MSAMATQSEAIDLNAPRAINPLSSAYDIPISDITAAGTSALKLTGTTTISATEDSLKYYKFTLSKPSKVNMVFSDLNTNVNYVYRPSISLFGLNAAKTTAFLFDLYFNQEAAEGKTSLTKNWYLPKGTYYLEVDANDSDVFKVKTKITKYNETNSEGITDAVVSYKSGKAIKWDKKITGLIATQNSTYSSASKCIDEEDYYKITVPYNTSIDITTTAAPGLKGSKYYFYTKSGTLATYKEILNHDTGTASGTLGKKENFEVVKGTYYLLITDRTYENSTKNYMGGDYTLKFSKGPKLAAKFVSKASKKIKLSWAAVKGADKYEIYRSTNAISGFKKIKQTSAKSFTTTLPSFGTTYYYKVRAIDGGKKGTYSSTWGAYVYLY